MNLDTFPRLIALIALAGFVTLTIAVAAARHSAALSWAL